MASNKDKPLIIQAAKAQTGHPLKNLLLIYLADYWSAQNGAYPSQETLAKRSASTRMNVNRKLKELERDGWITSKSRKAENGADQSKEYHLNPAKLGESSGLTGCNDRAQGVSREITGGESRDHTISLLKSPSKSLMKSTPIVPSEFDEFYAAYPHKAGRAAALKAWNKLDPPPALINRIMEDIKQRVIQGAWDTGSGKAFIPHPSTYINQGRWEDDIIPRPDYKPTPEQRAEKTRAMLDQMDKEGTWIS